MGLLGLGIPTAKLPSFGERAGPSLLQLQGQRPIIAVATIDQVVNFIITMLQIQLLK